MTPEETAWLAGLLEGEGSFLSWKLKKPNRADVVRIQMSSTDRDIIERVVALTGMGSVKPLKLNPSQLGKKPAWLWLLGSKADIRELCLRLRPWMGSRRSEQIDKVLACTEGLVIRPVGTCRNGHAIVGDNATSTGRAFACRRCIRERRMRQRRKRALMTRPATESAPT